MSAAVLISLLEERGVSLRVEGGQLKVNAPAGALTSDDLTYLAEQKPALLEHLGPVRLPWRAVVAGWSIEERQTWADRVDLLEECGCPWDEAEHLAFEELHR